MGKSKGGTQRPETEQDRQKRQEDLRREMDRDRGEIEGRRSSGGRNAFPTEHRQLWYGLKNDYSHAWHEAQRFDQHRTAQEGVKTTRIPPEAYRTLARAEEEIEKYQRGTPFMRRYERGVGTDAAGNKVFEQWGSHHQVRIPYDAFQRMQGGTFTHNHPSSGSFSPNDWISASRMNLMMMRAIGDDVAHELQRPAGGWPSESVIRRTWRQAERSVRADFAEMTRRGDITLPEVHRDYIHNINMRMAESLNVPYARMWRPAAEAKPGETILKRPGARTREIPGARRAKREAAQAARVQAQIGQLRLRAQHLNYLASRGVI